MCSPASLLLFPLPCISFMNFSERSDKPELLDLADIPFNDIQRNMAELNVINTYLGGHHITIEGIKKFINGKKEISICEIGCGGGDNLLAIRSYCSKRNIFTKCMGIDINPDCITFAKKKLPDRGFFFTTSDYRKYFFEEKPDIIFTSLFCHHFNNEELISMLQWMESNSGLGFFINDLHRHALAYYSIRILTRLFSKSYLVKNDAPLSVLRGFTRKDWEQLLQSAGLAAYSLQWKWAFRWLIVFKKDHSTNE